jgi:branched-chain amino acid transport system substrate-binding protein
MEEVFACRSGAEIVGKTFNKGEEEMTERKISSRAGSSGISRRELIRRAGVTAGATALAASFPAPWVRAAGPIRIGFVSPQTGPLAPFAEADNFVIAGVREIFKKQNRPIEIIAKDSQTNSNRAAEVTSDLILKDKVSLVLVGAAPETDNPVSDQCELNEVPCVSSVSPWQPWFFARGGKPDQPFKWTYHFFWGLEDAIAAYIGMWRQIETNRIVGGVFANDPDGNAWGDANLGLPPALRKNEFKFVDPGRFQTHTDNFSAYISAFKNAGADIVTGNMIPPDFTTFWTQARQQSLRPKIVTIGKALLFPASVESLGAAADKLSTEVWWSPNHPFKSSLSGQTASEFATSYTKATGKQWSQPLGYIHALFEVASDILKRSADPSDPAANLKALTATKLNTLVGNIEWGSGPVKNVAKTPLVGGQWRLTADKPFKYDLLITDNSLAPSIPIGAKMAVMS